MARVGLVVGREGGVGGKESLRVGGGGGLRHCCEGVDMDCGS